jgi:hypothetical protein
VGHTVLTVEYVLSVLLGHVSFALTVQYVLSVLLGHVSFAVTVQCMLSVPLDHVSFACDCASRHVTVHSGTLTVHPGT